MKLVFHLTIIQLTALDAPARQIAAARITTVLQIMLLDVMALGAD